MGNILKPFSEFERWNTTSVNIIMALLIFRYDIMQKDTTIKTPLTLKEYMELERQMEGFLNWYKRYEYDEYLPSGGIEKMFKYEIIKTTFDMNKNNAPLFDILKIWTARSPHYGSIGSDEKQIERLNKPTV